LANIDFEQHSIYIILSQLLLRSYPKTVCFDSKTKVNNSLSLNGSTDRQTHTRAPHELHAQLGKYSTCPEDYRSRFEVISIFSKVISILAKLLVFLADGIQKRRNRDKKERGREHADRHTYYKTPPEFIISHSHKINSKWPLG
jgi:hypothetical protein